MIGVVEAPTDTLLERVGVTVERIASHFVERMVSDPELSPHFRGIDVVALKKSQATFLTLVLGGQATAERVRTLVQLDGEQFCRVVVHLRETLLRFGLSETLSDQLMLAVLSRALPSG